MLLTTYNQVSIPSIMYGTAWKKDSTTRLVESALSAGFKAIDTANQLIHYQEALVGEAFHQWNSIARDALFLQTKFTNVYGQDNRTPYDKSAKPATQVKQSFDSSLIHLHTNYVDSYVLHGPYYRNGLGEEDWEVWGAIEEIHRSGKARIIGVSNVSADQLSDLCAQSAIKPMVVQNRCFAVRGWDREVREICTRENIIYQGFSLLTANSQVLAHPNVVAIAKRVNATVAQVIFRFAMSVGMLPLTGTTDARHMKEDLESEMLQLSADEVRQIETIAC